jgi:hypothetical protein
MSSLLQLNEESAKLVAEEALTALVQTLCGLYVKFIVIHISSKNNQIKFLEKNHEEFETSKMGLEKRIEAQDKHIKSQDKHSKSLSKGMKAIIEICCDLGFSNELIKGKFLEMAFSINAEIEGFMEEMKATAEILMDRE